MTPEIRNESIWLKLAGLFVACLLTISFGSKVSKVVQNKETCVCAYDGFGYYMYLPFLANHGDLNIQPNWAKEIQSEYCKDAAVYQLYQRDNGNYVNIYHMGQAFIEAPAFYIGHWSAKLFGYKQDGFSKPYYIAFLVNAWLFLILGLYFFVRLMRLFFSQNLTALLVLITYFGTNFWATAIQAYTLQHIFLFALIASVFYYFFRAVKGEIFDRKDFLTSAVLFGLCCVIRPTHVLMFLVPLIYCWNLFPNRKRYFLSLSAFPIAAFIWNIPQFLYWKIVGGSWLILNLHTEELIVIDPNIWQFLFSFRKGWLLYSPLFLLIIPGLICLWKVERRLFYSITSFLIILVWVLSSWECWWYATSFGSRVMVDFYPLLILPLGAAIGWLSNSRKGKWGISIFLFASCVLSIFQTWQYLSGYLHHERMTKDQYAFIFAKTDYSDFNESRLLINRSDVSWVSSKQHFLNEDYRLVSTTLYEAQGSFEVPPRSDYSIAKFSLLDKLPTDETMIEVVIDVDVKDSISSSVLRLETCSKYNCYSWNSIELTKDLKRGRQLLHYQFNLPDIRHRKDQLQVYVTNPSDQSIHIEKLTLKACSLIRH